MSGNNLKVESGLQLLARLTKRTGVQKFYPLLFENGPEAGHVIELYSEQSTVHVLLDILTESLLPKRLGGVEASILIFNTDGHLCFDTILHTAKRKLLEKIQRKDCDLLEDNKVENLLQTILKNIFITEIQDVEQFYITIQNLENILSKHCNISLIIFDTLTAFYWSEQDFKITKMDYYLKKLLLHIQRVTKDFKVTILYTRPEYFSSTKESISNLEVCSEHASEEQVNYRLQVVYKDNGIHHLNIQTHKNLFTKEFSIENDYLKWL